MQVYCIAKVLYYWFLMVLSSGWRNDIQPKNGDWLTDKIEGVPDGTLIHKAKAPGPITVDLANISTISGNESLTGLEGPSRSCRLSAQGRGWEPNTRAYPSCYSLNRNMRAYNQNALSKCKNALFQYSECSLPHGTEFAYNKLAGAAPTLEVAAAQQGPRVSATLF
jgi:hypothetical protein